MSQSPLLRRRGTLAAALCFVGLVMMVGGCANPLGWADYPAAELLDALTPDEWSADIALLREELPRRNPHFRADPEMAARFDAEAQRLIDALAEVSVVDADWMVASIARLVALVGEGHTSINASPTSYFPLLVRWLADGLFVAGVQAEHADILGAEVVGLRRPDGESVSLADLDPILNSVISVDHENGYRPLQSQVLINPVLMRGLGLADASGVVYLLRVGGGVVERRIEETLPADLNIVRIYDDSIEVPISRSRPEEANWFARTGEVDRVLYLRYDDCTLDAFGLFREVMKEVKDETVQRLIVDLRGNRGGNSIPGTWFSIRLAGVRRLQTDGGIFVLIGPNTFSSGMMLAVDLMDRTDAIFAGEPLAESPDSWGEVKRFALPNSGLVIGHSTKLFRYSRGKDLRLDEDGNLIPDEGFHIVATLAEYAAGRDVVLERVLAYPYTSGD